MAQKTDVRPYAGQEMVFECDLLTERAAYGWLGEQFGLTGARHQFN